MSGATPVTVAIRIKFAGATQLAIGTVEADGMRVLVMQPDDPSIPRLAPGDIVQAPRPAKAGGKVHDWTLVHASGAASSLDSNPGWTAERYVEWFEEAYAWCQQVPPPQPGPLPSTQLVAFLRFQAQVAQQLPTPQYKLASGAMQTAAPIIKQRMHQFAGAWKDAVQADPEGAEKLSRARRLAGLDPSLRQHVQPTEPVRAAVEALDAAMLDPHEGERRFTEARPSGGDLDLAYGLHPPREEHRTVSAIEPSDADAGPALGTIEDRHLEGRLPEDFVGLYALCDGIAVVRDAGQTRRVQSLAGEERHVLWLVLPAKELDVMQTDDGPVLAFGLTGAMRITLCPRRGSVWLVPMPTTNSSAANILGPFLASGEISETPVEVAPSIPAYLHALARRGGRPLSLAPAVTPPGAVESTREQPNRLATTPLADLHEQWLAHWRHTVAVIARGDQLCTVVPLRVADPLTEAELHAIEESLGRPLPATFARALTTLAGSVEFAWSCDRTPPGELRDITGGGSDAYGLWDAHALVEMNAYLAEEHGPSFLAFTGQDGDWLAFDMRDGSPDPPVVLISHEAVDADECVLLAPDFESFMTRWSALSCPDVGSIPQLIDDRGLVEDGLAGTWRAWLAQQ